jgi:hypothetical protein
MDIFFRVRCFGMCSFIQVLIWTACISQEIIQSSAQTIDCTASPNSLDPSALAAYAATCSTTQANLQLCSCSGFVSESWLLGKTWCKEFANETCACVVNTYKLVVNSKLLCVKCPVGKFSRNPGMVHTKNGVTDSLLSFCVACPKTSSYMETYTGLTACVCNAGYESYSCSACPVCPLSRK